MSRASSTIQVPPAVRNAGLRTLSVHCSEDGAAVYLREDDFRLRVIQRQPVAELRLGRFDSEGVLVAVLLLRLDRNDAMTFETWVNAGTPAGVRTLQTLGDRTSVDLVLVGNTETRVLPLRSGIGPTARRIVDEIRTRPAWNESAFSAACRRVSGLYPGVKDLWWAADGGGK